MHDNHPLLPGLLIMGLMLSFAGGCRSIDSTPLERLPPYQKTRSDLQNVMPVQSLGAAEGPLLAGGARIDITPRIGTPLAGYGNRMGRGSAGVHDRIYARAMALQTENLTVILVAADVLAITDDMVQAIFHKTSREIPIRPESLMVSATHTHSGPGAVAKRFWESFATGPFNPDSFEWITDRMAGAAIRAYRTMRPARLGSGSVTAPEWIRNRMVPQGPTDPAVEFMAIETLDRGLTLYLVNYSAHATVLKDDNYLVSGDYPGAMERHLEKDGGVIALFTAGAVADQTAHPPPGKDAFDAANQMGQQLANKVLEASRNLSFQKKISVGAVKVSVDLPPTQVKMGSGRTLAFGIGNFFFDRTTTLQAIRIGKTMLIGVPCDLSAEIGLEIKNRLNAEGRHGIIIGFANDYIGYVIPNRYYFTDAYEARMSFNGPYMDRYLSEVIDELIGKLTPSGRTHAETP